MAVPTMTRNRMESTHVMSMGVTTLRPTWPPKYRAHDRSGVTVEENIQKPDGSRCHTEV